VGTLVLEPAPDLHESTELGPPPAEALEPPPFHGAAAGLTASALIDAAEPAPAWRDPLGRLLFVAAALLSALLTGWIWMAR
jgi:hypothetical protein